MIDPAKIAESTKEELLDAYLEARDIQGVAEATKKIIADEIISRMKLDGEVIKGYSVTKVKKYSFKVTIEEAREYGAIKEAVDNKALENIYKSGGKIPESKVRISIYPYIIEIKSEDHVTETKRG